MKPDTFLDEVTELLIRPIVRRLSKGSQERLTRLAELEGSSTTIERLKAFLVQIVPESVLQDPDIDTVELLLYCGDLLRQYSSKDLAVVLGVSSKTTNLKQSQPRLYLPYIEVPSEAIYYQVRNAVATKGFSQTDASVFPTAPIHTHNANGEAQLKPPELDNIDRLEPEYEAQIGKLMFEQRDELSDTDSDILD